MDQHTWKRSLQIHGKWVLPILKISSSQVQNKFLELLDLFVFQFDQQTKDMSLNTCSDTYFLIQYWFCNPVKCKKRFRTNNILSNKHFPSTRWLPPPGQCICAKFKAPLTKKNSAKFIRQIHLKSLHWVLLIFRHVVPYTNHHQPSIYIYGLKNSSAFCK